MKFSLVEAQQEEIKHSNSFFKAITKTKMQLNSVDKIQTTTDFCNSITETGTYLKNQKRSRPEFFD